MRGLFLVCLLAALPARSLASSYLPLNGFFAGRVADAGACVEISGIEASGANQKKGKLTETHFVRDNEGNILRYTISGAVKLGNSLARWGSNGTANFSSSEVSLGLVLPAEDESKARHKLTPLKEGQARACQYFLTGNKRALFLECNPPLGAAFHYLGFERGDMSSKDFPDKTWPWSNPASLLRQPESCHSTIGAAMYKDFRFMSLPMPSSSSFVLRVTLETTLNMLTKDQRRHLAEAAAGIGDLPADQASLEHVMGGSLVAQFKIEADRDDARRETLYRQWVASVDAGGNSGALVKLAGVPVIAADFFWHDALGFNETPDKVPGWAAMLLILGSMFFLCWVAYTVQCRHMVLELERQSVTDSDQPKYAYKRVAGRDRPLPT